MTTYEHRVSERTLLVPGKVFKAREGPLFRMDNGELEPLVSRGPYIFVSREVQNDCVLIHAIDRDGCHALLHVAGERKSSCDQIIPRPYVITQSVRKIKQCRTQRKSKTVAESHKKMEARIKRGRKASRKSRTT
jgi:hypothetical protein